MDIDRVDHLSDELRDVLYGIACLKKYHAIAHDLGIVEATVKKRVARAIELLGARDRNQAVAIFVRWNARRQKYNEGIISPKFFDLRLLEREEPGPEVQPATRLEDASAPTDDRLQFLPKRGTVPASAGATSHDLTRILLRVTAAAALFLITMIASGPLMENISRWGRNIYIFFH